MDYKKILTGLLSTAYKMDDGKISEILTEDGDESAAEKAIMEADKSRVKKLSGDGEETLKEKFQEGYKKAKKESLSAFEGELKEKMGVGDSDLQGIELVQHIVSKKLKEGGAKEITEEDVRQSKTFLEAEKKWKADLELEQKKYNEREAELGKKEAFGNVLKMASPIFDGLDPVLPEDPNVASKQKQRLFVDELASYDYKAEGDTFIVLKDGKVLKDPHGNTLDFETHVRNVAGSNFTFKKNNEGENAGNDKEKGGGKGGGNDLTYPKSIGKEPANLEELAKIVNNQNLPLADRQQAAKVFKAKSGQK